MSAPRPQVSARMRELERLIAEMPPEPDGRSRNGHPIGIGPYQNRPSIEQRAAKMRQQNATNIRKRAASLAWWEQKRQA